MNRHEQKRLSKTISHALRHAPWLYELELDENGWTALEDLLLALRGHRKAWESLALADLETMVEKSDKQRFEISGELIRARYGHSLPDKLAYEAAPPPAWLYHGTTRQALPLIMESGLKPMRRQYVHLSIEQEMAQQVGSRKRGDTIILIIQAAEAHHDGLDFYRGNQFVWLADAIPAAYLMVQETESS